MGVITMKMMISTGSTSIIGVTLICAFCPLPPVFMLIMLDWTSGAWGKFPRVGMVWWGRHIELIP
jgi:hypothetical protein